MLYGLFEHISRIRNSMSAHLRPGFDWSTPTLLLGSAAYLYANLFASPTVPFLLSGDQVYFWMNALRTLQGARIYQDFFQFTPPGTDLLYLVVFKLFGLHVWACNAVVLGLGVALSWLCFKIAKLIMGRPQAFLAAWLFLVLIYGKLLNATHHWFSMLAAMAAVAILMKARTPERIVISGFLLGVASFFTQTRGPVAALGIAIFLFWEKIRTEGSWPDLLRRQALLISSFIATLTILSGYFIITTGIRQLWYFQITYVRQYMLSGLTIPSLGLPETPTWRNLPAVGQYLLVYALLPVVYGIALWRCWRERRNPPSIDAGRIALLALVGLVLLAEVAQSLNWLRVYCIAMPGIILLVWILRTARLRTYLVGSIWVGILCLAIPQISVRHHRKFVTVELPAGRVAAPPQTYEKLQWLMQNSKPGEPFFEAGWPGLYLPLRLSNPVYLDALGRDEQTRPQYIELSIRQLEAKQVPHILWSPRLDSPDSFNPPGAYHLNEFREYLHSHYQRVLVFSDRDEIWVRK
jgi:hypothetical protein